MTPIDWDQYSERLHRQGVHRRERLITRTKEKIRNDILLNPACRQVTIDDIPQYLYIQRSDLPTKRFFNTLPDEPVSLGQVVLWEGSHWLVTECLHDDEMTYRGAFEQCNRQLIWQNPDTREIVRRWCTIQKPYYSNLRLSTVVTLSEREFKIQMPYDAETSRIDLGKRFILDYIAGEPKCYKCTSVDANTERYDINGQTVGFLVMNIEQDQFNPKTDNKELEICDYLPPFDVLHETEGGYCVLEPESPTIVPGGLPLTIRVTHFTKDGTVVPDSHTRWTVTAPPDAEGYLTDTENDHALTLQLDYNSRLIGKSIFVEVTDDTGKRKDKLVVKVVNGV